jgi:uncharacterized protein (TIGR03435 family)
VRARTTCALVALGMLLQVPLARSQAAAFEAASIKPTHDTPGSTSGINSTRGRITGRNVTLKRCIRGAYDIPETLILSGPKWIDEDRYDIDAVASDPAGDHEMMVMLQSLLVDRFQLKLHREQKEMSGYALVVKNGPRVERVPNDTSATTSASRGRLEARASTMANLAQKLSDALKVPVVDVTHLEGRFNFTLSWDPTDVNPSGPSVFTALQEQLGLKLESRKVPVDVLVIDAASKPSVN